jgi:hypothetical protein
MSIRREDLDAGRVDFSGVVTGKRLRLVHPGEILRDDFLLPMKISVYALALATRRRGRGSTTSCLAAAASAPTPHSALRVISAPRRISGSTFRRVTTWRPPIENCAGGSSVKSGRGPPDESEVVPLSHLSLRGPSGKVKDAATGHGARP